MTIDFIVVKANETKTSWVIPTAHVRASTGLLQKYRWLFYLFARKKIYIHTDIQHVAEMLVKD